jgi:hypothetical protein
VRNRCTKQETVRQLLRKRVVRSRQVYTTIKLVALDEAAARSTNGVRTQSELLRNQCSEQLEELMQ